MNLTDVLILVGLLLYTVLGWRDGLMKKVFGVIGFWGGLIIATKFMEYLGIQMVHWFSVDEDTAYVLAFCTIFVIISLVVNLSYRWFGKVGTESLSTFSRIGGAVLGIAQGLVAVSLILLMFNIFDIPSEETQNDSLLYNDTMQIAPEVFDYSTSWIPDSKMFFDEMKGKLKHVNFAR